MSDLERCDSLHVVCHSFFDASGRERAIGGVETYVQLLSSLALKRGWRTFVYQAGQVRSTINVSDRMVVFICDGLADAARQLAKNKQEHHGIVVYSDYHSTPRKLEHPSIFLQHGVGWDYVVPHFTNHFLKALDALRMQVKRARLFRRIRTICRRVDSIVCVDTNFGNFMQATFPSEYKRYAEKFNYVPNCSSILARDQVEQKWHRPGHRLRCIFPRRYAEIRGALLFAEVVRDITPMFPDVDFCFIGTGECERQMRHILKGCSRVEFYRRAYREMAEEYIRADVAVIPTLAAEGTSLSCIEAMSAGCAVIATSIGGLPNLVIPGFSGVLCKATKSSILKEVAQLLRDRDEIRRLGRNGYEVARASFSIDAWEERFGSVLCSLNGSGSR
jgi:glycosyltransferase involved in cell wall biosynthesis